MKSIQHYADQLPTVTITRVAVEPEFFRTALELFLEDMGWSTSDFVHSIKSDTLSRIVGENLSGWLDETTPPPSILVAAAVLRHMDAVSSEEPS